jgi:hypothetical protein
MQNDILVTVVYDVGRLRDTQSVGCLLQRAAKHTFHRFRVQLDWGESRMFLGEFHPDFGECWISLHQVHLVGSGCCGLSLTLVFFKVTDGLLFRHGLIICALNLIEKGERL